ncbi:hypothetical protein HNP99_003571 [Flavobacterium sp. 28A]|uniref:hypothetical protein n=1 Tax=Flavobacterium sp. 28A TaxID=2735895 RepID=UPI0015702CC6|nr:hypothetical protein [Flavobacterium sp. 28A]NRT17191.1 hypothetical protein [Flavobacterium sp. 28A]
MRTENKQRTFIYITFLIIGIMITNSCNSTKSKISKTEENLIPVAEKTIDVDISLGKIEKYIDIEKRINSEDVTRDYFVDIGEGIYPFIKNHSFEIPKEFKFIPETSIELSKSYYYTKDGNVKLILYEWNKMDTATVDSRKFKSIFINLEKIITAKIGQYSSKKIESDKLKNDKTYRDDVKWKSSELNAYLFRFGDRNNNYNQIRLAIYKD